MTTSREKFETWYDTAEENNEDINCWQAWQAGREALLAEIKAGDSIPVFIGVADKYGKRYYRLPEGEQHE